MKVAGLQVETSHAILRLSGKYVLQLRDDKPCIAAPGQWSLFGGRIASKETPLEAMKRELFEELTVRPKKLNFLWYKDYYCDIFRNIIRTWFFISELDNVWGSHQLKEGKAVDIFSFQDLKGLVIPSVMRQALNQYHLRESIVLNT